MNVSAHWPCFFIAGDLLAPRVDVLGSSRTLLVPQGTVHLSTLLECRLKVTRCLNGKQLIGAQIRKVELLQIGFPMY